MDFMRYLIRGFTWKAKMYNEAVFEFWTPTDITRQEARQELLKVANGGYAFPCPYDAADVIQLWKTDGGLT